MKQHPIDPFQAVADPSRRQILGMLSGKPMSINTIADSFEMSRPAVSKHVKILYLAGFIAIEDKGRERYCTLQREGFKELQSWISYFDNFWTTKLQALDEFLANDKLSSDTKNKKRK